MISESLTVRTIVAGLVWITVALGAGGWVILEVFRPSAARQFDARLEVQLDLLTASIARSDEDPASRMINPDFLRVYSGFYWQAQDDRGTLLRSRSLWDTKLAVPNAGPDTRRTVAKGPDGQMLHMVSQKLTARDKRTWTLTVAANRAVLERESVLFQRTLLISATILGAVLLAAAFLLLRTALLPLQALRQAVLDRQSCDGGQIVGTFPNELSPLVEDLNSLLLRNERLREKGRLQAANLAHALKTPAAILRNELVKARRGDEVNIALAEEAVENLSAAADRHLSLAAAAPDDMLWPVTTDIVPVAGEVVRAIGRLFSEVAFKIDAAESVPVNMSRPEQLELLGNIVENAGKWARGRVLIGLANRTGRGVVTVEDDGPGVPEPSRARILQQGVRLDESRGGSGLGLTIAADIVDRHKGSLNLDTSALGGLRVEIVIPSQP